MKADYRLDPDPRLRASWWLMYYARVIPETFDYNEVYSLAVELVGVVESERNKERESEHQGDADDNTALEGDE